MSLNSCVLIGRLGKDPELKYIQDGKPLCMFSLAVDRQRKGETDWFSVVCFGKTAEAAAQYLGKGREAAVQGNVQLDKWTSKDGEERVTLKLIANEVRFIGGQGEAAPAKARETEEDLFGDD